MSSTNLCFFYQFIQLETSFESFAKMNSASLNCTLYTNVCNKTPINLESYVMGNFKKQLVGKRINSPNSHDLLQMRLFLLKNGTLAFFYTFVCSTVWCSQTSLKIMVTMVSISTFAINSQEIFTTLHQRGDCVTLAPYPSH